MDRKSARVPKFRSESEEADWYATPEGRKQTQREFARALRAGSLSHSPGTKIAKTDPKILQQLMNHAKETATRPISLRLPVADIERAKQIAKKTGLGYQVILKQAIRQGLRKAM
jgi:hypothetical protein